MTDQTSKPAYLWPSMALVIIAGVVWTIYSRALDSPFIFDDSVSIVQNTSIRTLQPLIGDVSTGGPLNPHKELPTSGRPLVNLSLALNYYFGQLDPRGYHIFNIVVHVLSAWLLMLIVWRTLLLDYFDGLFARCAGLLAFCSALLWAVHPLQTEPLVYVTQRTELMVGFFYLATLYGCLRYWSATSSGGHTLWLIVSAAACLAGMACKEVMATAPLVVLLYERTFISGTFRRALQNSWPLYVGLSLGWFLLLFLNIDAPRSTTAGFNIGVAAATWWYTQAKIFWMYLRLIVWPWPLSIHYQLPYLNIFGEAWFWLLATGSALAASLWLLWRRRAAGFVGTSIFLILAPTMIVPIVTEMAADRRMYLPLAAFIPLVVAGAFTLAQRTALKNRSNVRKEKLKDFPPARWPEYSTAAIALILTLTFSLVSSQRLLAYHDPVTMWEDVIASQPDNFFAHYNLGNIFSRTGRVAEAVDHYYLALQVAPQYAEAHNNLGLALASLGQTQAAIDEYRQALAIRPNYVEPVANTALAYASLHQPDVAIQTAQKAIDTARANGQTLLAHQIQAWLTDYRASLSNQK